MSRRVLRPRKCGTGAGGSCCRGTGAAADAGARRGGPRPTGVRQWRRRRRCRRRRVRLWRRRRGGCRHRRRRWRRRWCGGRWRWHVCGRMGGCGRAPSQGVFDVLPFKRRQASGKEVRGWLFCGRGCGVGARVGRAHCRRRGCGHCERIARSRVHLHAVRVARFASAVQAADPGESADGEAHAESMPDPARPGAMFRSAGGARSRIHLVIARCTVGSVGLRRRWRRCRSGC